MELIRREWFAVLFAAVLTGCSSSGTDSVLASVLSDLTTDAEDDSGENITETITRDQIDAAGVAMLRVRGRVSPERRLLVALRKTGDQVTYVLRRDRRLVMVGGLIQSTYGFGDNLAPVGIRAGDPIAEVQPLAEWPDSITRDYYVSALGPGEATTVTCTFYQGERGTIEIVGLIHEVQAVNEVCEGPDWRFVNRHLVAPATGFLWQSDQWTGPNQGALKYEVLEPLD